MTKNKVKFDFVPTSYQEKFFDFVEHGVGNGVIKATAGSGKTTTAIASMKLIPKEQRILFISFNRSIAQEISSKLKNRKGAFAKTTHQLGFSIIKANLGSDIEVDEYKYRKYVKANIGDLTTTCGEIKTQRQVAQYIDNITALINFSRFNLAQSEKEINEVAQRYSIPVSFDECVVAKKCLEWGKENTETIDYTDMIWLPVELSMRTIGNNYDWVFFDEAQDASLCTIQLFLKCIKRGGRFVAIGDDLQSINMFAGASEEAFKFLQEYPNTTLFDLPITYRCAKTIVSFANSFAPDMQAREDAPEGIIKNNCHITDIKEGDMVLARTKSPLVKLYVKLLRKGVNSYIKGLDIGKNMIKVLENINCEELNVDMDKDGVFVRLYNNLFEERNKLMQTRGLDFDDATLSSFIMDKYDTINALMILAEKRKTKTDLIEHIEEIFQENSKGVCLSTIHKAKGLESENIYILCHSTMPSKLAVYDWEKKQEYNLMYVAYTRAKNMLGFVSEREIKPDGSSMDPMEIINELAFIEQKVCAILGKEPMERLGNIDLSRFKLQNMSKIEDIHKDDNVVVMKHNNKDNDLLDELENLLK